MSFGESIKRVFKNLTNFQGRARRSEFWWFYLFVTLVSLPLAFVVYIPLMLWGFSVGAAATPNTTSLTDEQATQLVVAVLATVGLAFLLGLVVFGLTLAVWVRRLHDAGYSGHWLWLSLAGLSIVPLVFAILEGQPHENRWGPDPKAVERVPSPYQHTSPTYAAPPTQATAPAPPVTPPAAASGDTSDPFAAPPPQQ